MQGLVLVSIGLTMIARNEVGTIGPTLEAARPLVDRFTILDTGSTDKTEKIIRSKLRGIPGEIIRTDWQDFGKARTEVLAAARGKADWNLMLDADMIVEPHPDLKAWLETDPDPGVDAWRVEIEDSGTVWRLPWLTRGNLAWEYVGPTHEYLHPAGRRQRDLLGLVLRHRRPQTPEQTVVKMRQHIALLAEGYAKGEPRATFYTAESYRFLGETAQAISVYLERAAMTGGFEEERWFAQFQAAKLGEDPSALIIAWQARPHRHEPLTALARIVERNGPQDDCLFLEPTP